MFGCCIGLTVALNTDIWCSTSRFLLKIVLANANTSAVCGVAYEITLVVLLLFCFYVTASGLFRPNNL